MVLLSRGLMLSFYVVAVIALVGWWLATDSIYAMIVIAFLSCFVLAGWLAEVRGDVSGFSVSPRQLQFELRGLFRSRSIAIASKDIAYIYAQQPQAIDVGSQEAAHLVIGYHDARIPSMLEVHDDDERKAVAELIRQHFKIAEFPASGRAHAGDLFCLNCQYDMRWIKQDTGTCPECGVNLEPWQIEDWRKWQNHCPQMTCDTREGE